QYDPSVQRRLQASRVLLRGAALQPRRQEFAMTPLPHRQRGATLIVSLIMLLLITLLAVSSFTLGKGNLQIVGNMQQRQQAFAAAQGAVASVISSNQFSATPTDALDRKSTRLN